MGKLRLTLLGPPSVVHGDETCSFPTRKALALLVYLAVEGGRHSRDKLAALFWPESDRPHGRAMLRYTLTTLRRGLADASGEAHLIVEGDAIGLDCSSGIEIDLRVLELSLPLEKTALRQAAEICRGEFLEGFALTDAPDFDDWAGLQREGCRHKMERALGGLTRLQAERGELAEAVETVRRWVAISPLNEAAYRRLMELHFASGDRDAALRAYDACSAMLDNELHVRPAPETESLAERIRSSNPSVGPDRRRHMDSTPGVVLDSPLVGRADEFLELVELYHAARQGSARLAVIKGEPGIGKTRLAREFLAWAAGHGADVLEGRAFESGGRLPFQPLVDALRPRFDRENAPEDLLSDVWLTELGRLLPELRDRYPDLPVPAGDEVAARTRLFEAIARLGHALALRSPLVLLVDDVQWADSSSLDVLRYAGRRWAELGAPLLLVLNVRSEALADSPTLDEWLVGLRRDLVETEIDLRPLTAADTFQLVQGFGGKRRRSSSRPVEPDLERVANWLFAETCGQPLFALETIRELLDRGALALCVGEDGDWEIDARGGLVDPAAIGRVLPPGVRAMIRGRLGRLGHAAREFLTAAAVIGQGFTFDQVSQVAGIRDEEALSAADSVVRADLLRQVDAQRSATLGDYVFTHDKIRDVVYAEAGDVRQRVFHRRAAHVLAATAPAAQLARHAIAAGLNEPAVQFSLAAGDEAMRLLAARDALGHYGRALNIAERSGWTARLADLHARCGKAYSSMALWADARCELQAALDGLSDAQRERRAEVLVDLLEVCWWLLDTSSLRRWATEALSLAEDLGRGDLQTLARGWLAAALGADGDVPACVAHSERALARAHELGISPPAPACTYLSLSLYWLGRVEEAVVRGGEGVAAARAAHHTTATMFSLPHLGLALAGNGRYAEAIQVFDDARRFGREYGVDTLLARAIAISAGLHLDVWDFETNEALAEEARDRARSLNFAPPAVSAGIDLLLNFARRHEVGRAEALIGEVAASVRNAAGWHGWLWSLRLAEAQAELALARGDWQVALTFASDAIERGRARHRVKYEVIGLTTRAQALLALGRANEAIAELNAAVSVARPVADPALFLRPAAELLSVDGNGALASEAGSAVQRIAAALPHADMRRRFAAAAAVQTITRLPGQARVAI